MCASSRHMRLCVFFYLTFVPEAHKILWDFRDLVTAEESNRAGSKFWLSTEHLFAKLLQLGMVTVKEKMPSQLFRILHRTETTVSPKAVFLSLAENDTSFIVIFVFRWAVNALVEMWVYETDAQQHLHKAHYVSNLNSKICKTYMRIWVWITSNRLQVVALYGIMYRRIDISSRTLTTLYLRLLQLPSSRPKR